MAFSCVITQLNSPDQKTTKTSAFTEVPTLVVDQLLRFIRLAEPCHVLPVRTGVSADVCFLSPFPCPSLPLLSLFVWFDLIVGSRLWPTHLSSINLRVTHEHVRQPLFKVVVELQSLLDLCTLSLVNPRLM